MNSHRVSNKKNQKLKIELTFKKLNRVVRNVKSNKKPYLIKKNNFFSLLINDYNFTNDTQKYLFLLIAKII